MHAHSHTHTRALTHTLPLYLQVNVSATFVASVTHATGSCCSFSVCIHSPTHSPTHLPTHSFIHSLIHSFLLPAFCLIFCFVCRLALSLRLSLSLSLGLGLYHCCCINKTASCCKLPPCGIVTKMAADQLQFRTQLYYTQICFRLFHLFCSLSFGNLSNLLASNDNFRHVFLALALALSHFTHLSSVVATFTSLIAWHTKSVTIFDNYISVAASVIDNIWHL